MQNQTAVQISPYIAMVSGADWRLPVMPEYDDGMLHKEKIVAIQPLIITSMILAVGLALRLYGLRAESAWWDEYASLAFLDAPSLGLFLHANRALDPATLPLYFVLEYFWAQWVSASVFSLRLMSIAIGVAAIPIVYALGARLYGRHAGYVAALCLALSPMHIHHSQGIRMYGLLVLLAVASFWSLVRMVQQGKRGGWWLHGVASMLLYWTHPFALLVPAAQGCWLLLDWRVFRKLLPGWILMHAMLSLPVVAYILSIRFWPQETTAKWLAAPGIGALLADLFFDDIIAFHWQLRLGDVGVKLGGLRMTGDLLLAAVIVLGLALSLWIIARTPRTDIARNTRLLLLWLLLPPLALFVASLLWRPCMFPRYTAHCAVAMYILLGGMVQQLRRRDWRWCATGAIALLFLFQWALTLPGPQRTDWQSAARHLHRETTSADLVLVEDLLWRDVFVYNAEHVADVTFETPVVAAADGTLLAAQTILFLGMSAAALPRPAAWAVIAADYFETMPPHDFERALQDRGLAYERSKYPAIRDVYVYRIFSEPETPPLPDTLAAVLTENRPETSNPFPGYIDHHTMRAFAELAEALARQSRAAAAATLLQELFQMSPFAKQVYGNLARAIAHNEDARDSAEAVGALWDGYGYRENLRHERAQQAFALALERDPKNAMAAMELGMELAHLGRFAAAAEAWTQAAALDEENAELVDNLVAAIRADAEVTQKYEAVLYCRDGLIALSEGNLEQADALLAQALTHDPALPRAQVMLGFLRFLQERYDESFALFEGYLAHDAYHAPLAYAHSAMLHILRDEPEQALAHAQKAMELDEVFRQRMERLITALLVEHDYKTVDHEMQRLKEEGVHVPPQFEEYLDEIIAQSLQDQ